MPEFIDPQYQTYTPSGVVDSIDGNTCKRGGMIALANLIPDPETPGTFVCRAAAYSYTSFTGFTTPGYVSVVKNVGNFVVGMLSTARNAGHDEPFLYNRTTGAFVSIGNVTNANTPTSPATSGAWTPPTIDAVGGYIVFTHPGFSGNNFYGWLDMTGFSLTTMTANTSSGVTGLTSTSINGLTSGVTIGQLVAGSGIPSSTYITGVTATTITMSQAATANANGVSLTITGGAQTSPTWHAGNTNTNPLPSVPTSVSIFTDRAYFACANVLYYSDVLNPLNMANATNSLTLGGNDPITITIGQPFFTTNSGGILASLLAFKNAQIWQVTGDLATNNLALNKLSDGVGTAAPRSVAGTPKGTTFVASDGVRVVDLTGEVQPPNKDLKIPFLNPLSPTRIAAAYNVGFYRICTSYLQGGVMENVEFWYDTVRDEWCGPHTLTYDNICPVDATFFVTTPNHTGNIYQTNVIPNEQTDFFTEFGTNLTWTYQTVTVHEAEPMHGMTVEECSIFLGYQLQQTITCLILDQAYNTLGSYALVTNFLAPANATNWGIFFENTAGSNVIMVPSRHQFQLSGTSSMNLALGSLFAHYQYQAKNNALTVAAYGYSDLDFGSVTDNILNYVLDWGGVSDSTLATIDFELNGTHTGNP